LQASVRFFSSADEVAWPGIAELDELEETGKLLGRGSAGYVKLVKHKTTGQLYALKVRLHENREIQRKRDRLWVWCEEF
jgi:hypothetical protein